MVMLPVELLARSFAAPMRMLPATAAGVKRIALLLVATLREL